ncbi:ChaN family lipoprotein [Vibrio agarivorans]|uniref:ChaN family lipoprotein n=1 Tax=Vibrio agarivorans TaxID=153622 RepID=UPI0025B2C781|nr:ChaN family lipoprotein [Vibrio agarivorans]MDN3663680.1 ChaN family lipoprotein [Vibrio agarivorans]
MATVHSKTTLILTFSLFLGGCTQSNHAPAQPPSVAHYYDYQLLRQQAPVTLNTLPTDVLEADVILVGEWHTHSAVHRFQTDLYYQLLKQNHNVTLSMEQFSRDKQSLMDAYLKGTIGEQFLKRKANAWPNYESDYRSLVELAKSHQQKVIAANAPRDIVKCVGYHGAKHLDNLPESQRQWVAQDIDLSDNPYKSKFLSSMHHGDPAMNERQYAAQATWDETMAESIVNALRVSPKTQVMHIAGDFHINKGLGIGRVIQRLNPDLKVVTISPSAEIESGSDYTLLVLSPPKRYVQEKHQMEAYHSMGHTFKAPDCQ